MLDNILNIFNPNSFFRYLKNTSWLFTEQLIKIFAGFFVGIWVARFMGPTQFGIYSYSLAFVALFSAFPKLGLDAIVVKKLLENREFQAKYISTAFWLKLSSSLLTIFIIFIIVQFTSNDKLTNLYILIISLGLIFQSFEVVDFYFQAKVLSKYTSLCKIIQITLSTILKVLLLTIKAKLIYFILITLLDQIFLGYLYFYSFKKNSSLSIFKCFCLKKAKEMLKISWPLIISGISVLAYMRVDQIMIKEIVGDRAVGIYSVAAKISEVFYIIPTVITTSLFPAIISAKDKNTIIYNTRLKQLFKLLSFISLSLAIPVSLLSDWIVRLLFGPQYIEAAPILSIHIWAIIAVSYLLSSGKYMIAENLTKLILQRNLIGAILNILLNFILIPKFGLKGAAYSFVISFFFSGLLYDFLKPELRSMFFTKIKSFYPWSH